jgi:hypothetical protein
MKNLFILFASAITLASCTKQSDPQPLDATQSTWIRGKWKMTAAYTDSLATPAAKETTAYLDELNFISDTQVTSLGAATTFQYDLVLKQINENGNFYVIKQLSATTMSLTCKTAHLKLELFTKIP